MDNYDQLIQAVTIKYKEKMGSVNLPMDQVAHLVGHLVFEIFSKEVEDHARLSEALNGRR